MLSLRKMILTLSVFSLFFPLFGQIVLAHCPLCTAATGVAIGVARWYGVDDLIVGTFAGGFMMATGFWLNNVLLKRHKGKEYIPYQLTIIILFTSVSTIFTFATAGLTNSIYTLFGIDKIILGLIFGNIVSLIAFKFHDFLRQTNSHRNFFPFQVIVITLLLLSVTSASFYLVGWV